MKIKAKMPDIIIGFVFLFLWIYTIFPDKNLYFNTSRIILCAFIAVCVKFKKNQNKHYFLIWNLLFCVLCYLSSLWAIDGAVAIEGSNVVLFNAFCTGMIFLFCIDNKNYFWRIIKVIPFISISWPIIVIIRYSFLALLNVRYYMYGSLYNRPGFIAMLGAVISYYLLKIYNKKILLMSESKNKWLILFLINSFVCFLTTSRKSFFIMLIGIVLIEVFLSKMPIKKLIFILLKN